MRSIVQVALLLASVCWTAPQSWADPIFRWVDAEGVVNYGNKPPETGPQSKTVRSVLTDPAVVVHESEAERSARQERLLAAELAEEARLKRQLLQQQIDTERARAEALRAQAGATSSTSTACDPQTSVCDDERYLVAWARRGRGSFATRPAPPRPTPRVPGMSTPHVQAGVPARAF